MSETCIVCLGDLGENDSAAAIPPPFSAGPKAVKSPPNDDHHHDHLVPPTSPPLPTSNEPDDSLIAHLLPCGHDLHNECLKPWVERANSCPICRQSFNQVELCSRVGGPVISSYAVADRTQTADLDPDMLVGLVDDEEDPEEAPCPICGDDDNEDVLMECDGCNVYYHTYCMGLDSVPAGQWFCDNCQATRAIDSVLPPDERSQPRIHNQPATRLQTEASPRVRHERRTRGQQHRIRNRAQASSSNWARVWQSVWDNLNLDLDFPFDEDGGAANELDRATRASSQRREFLEWERRLQVAERQGGANRFRETASLLDFGGPSREQPALPEPESREEILAWNAFEKAKEIESDPTPKRKRKSATTSPVEPSSSEPTAIPERPLKRPRTRRNLDAAETSSTASHTPRRGSNDVPSSSSRTSITHNNTGAGPSFLQSMLKEIETSTAPDDSTSSTPSATITAQSRLPLSIATSTNHSSPHPSSPGLSPTSSNHATPRAGSTTPPLQQTSPRPSSPLSLTSKVEPIFPLAEYSPTRSPSEPPPFTTHHRQRKPNRQSRTLQNGSINHNSPASGGGARSADTSPARASYDLSSNSNNNSKRSNSTTHAPNTTTTTTNNKSSPPPPLPPPAPTTTTTTSPPAARTNMRLSTKTDLQKLVSNALKPHYQAHAVNKDQYTDINRSVSHMLYDLYGREQQGLGLDGGGEGEGEGGKIDEGNGGVGKGEDGKGEEGGKKWERWVGEEVAKAVRELKTGG